MRNPKKHLLNALEIIKKKSNWCQGWLARNPDGTAVDSFDPDACQWCVLGALEKVGAPDYVADWLEKQLGVDVDAFNDSYKHPAVIKRLRALCE